MESEYMSSILCDHSPGIMLTIKRFIWFYVDEFPWCTLDELVADTNAALHLDVKRSMIQNILKKWHWTFHRAWQINQLQKFTISNLLHYEDYIVGVQYLPWHKLHFLDEASFDSADCRRTRILGPANQPIAHTSTSNISETLKVTGLTNIDSQRPPVYLLITEEINNQYSFLDALYYFYQVDALQNGDILILDNARIHSAKDSHAEREQFYRDHSITVIYLPAYSPELNPCEQVWRTLKCWLRHNRNSDDLEYDINMGQKRISLTMMFAWYWHCLKLDM
ncbi:hypothetical protein Pelo_2956 [Pelomyxa schiedti]|nr:hypothetical protein Pelo_2956 [Pelomyxa schiedti]